MTAEARFLTATPATLSNDELIDALQYNSIRAARVPLESPESRDFHDRCGALRIELMERLDSRA